MMLLDPPESSLFLSFLPLTRAFFLLLLTSQSRFKISQEKTDLPFWAQEQQVRPGRPAAAAPATFQR